MFLRQYRDPAQALEELNTQMAAPGPHRGVHPCRGVFDTDTDTSVVARPGPGRLAVARQGGAPLRATGPLLMLDPNGTTTAARS